MANEIYHKSNWGSPEKNGWGDVYFNPSATNELYTRSDNYENSDGTDKALASKPDTQSVLMTPTAYNVGSMNSVLPPYEVLPTELITNGDFATDSDWTKGTGTTISGGFANFSSAGSVSLYQNIGTQEGSVKVVFSVTNYTSGTLNVYSGGNQSAGVINVSANDLGIYEVDVIRTGGNNNIIFGSQDNFTGSIDNVSVKEVRSADFTFDRSSTATRVNKEGLIETVAIDTPRLDYPLIDGVVQDCPALLLEPAITQVVKYSEDYSQTYWTKNLSTVTVDETISPDGTQNAAKVESSADGLNSRIEFFPTVTDNTTYTASIFVKKGDLNYIRLTLRTKAGVSVGADYDINNGSIGTTFYNPDGTNIEYYGNGWYRVSITEDVSSGASSVRVQYILASNDNSVDTDDNAYLYMWGAQVEASSYMTSYIPNDGTTATVTRSAETCNGAGTSDDFNDSEGVLYAEIAALADDATNRRISLSDGTVTNLMYISYKNYTNQIRAEIIASGSTVFDTTYSATNITTFSKIALKYKQNDFSLYIDGFKIAVDTSGNTPSGLSKLSLDRADNADFFYGRTKEVATFKEALTDSELETLTT